METSFFCLLRSSTAMHSLEAEQFLGDDRPLDEEEVLETSRVLYRALEPAAYPESLQRVDPLTLLVGWETEFAPGAGVETVMACTAAGCQVLAPVLWIESGEVLHLHGLLAGGAWRFSRARAPGEKEALEVYDDVELLALMQASLLPSSTGAITPS